ncbi:ARL14 effector protein-like [Daktulosphaira vitifoliae]|uniref:ARL14 effector protein-like n=1 Tax=Daktulosphaira vitifoliae TaxID=58002 RepID=UPI0021AAB8CD|nr:ARL14 effector protein-like [Daktulosphaira vitifoliae]
MTDTQTSSIGYFKQSDCFQTTYKPSKKIQCVSELSEKDKDLVHLRSEINLSEFKNICSHHSYYFLNVFERYQTICVDPLKKHKKPIKKSLKSVSLSFSKQLIEKNIHIKTVQKICSTC